MRKKVKAMIVDSVMKPGSVSIRNINGGDIRESLLLGGYKPGDIVEISFNSKSSFDEDTITIQGGRLDFN